MSDQTFDPQLGALLRAVLKAETARLPLTVGPEQILERGRAGNRGRFGSGLQLPRLMAAAGAAIVLVVAVAAFGMYLNRPGIGVEPSPPPSPGQTAVPAPVPYVLFDGQVTLRAADPWIPANNGTPINNALRLSGRDEFIVLFNDPEPIDRNCQYDLAGDAEALAGAIGSNPNLDATAPVSVTVGGAEALRIDVSAIAGARVCIPGSQETSVLKSDDDGWSRLSLSSRTRLRLYFMDAPEGSSMGTLAIAVLAPAETFSDVTAAAAPVIESLEFTGQ